MEYDDLELDTLGDRKTALFLIMSDTDTTFNFVIAMLQSHSRICMVLCKVILYCLAADVDKMDFPSFTYRPDSYTGMEIPGTDRSLQFVADGYYCCI